MAKSDKPKVSLDEQLEQAEERKKRADERVRRLKMRKRLEEAKQTVAENAKLKKQVTTLQQQLKNAKADNKLQGEVTYYRNGIQKLINMVNEPQKNGFGQWSGNDGKTPLLVRDQVVKSLNEILNHQTK